MSIAGVRERGKVDSQGESQKPDGVVGRDGR